MSPEETLNRLLRFLSGEDERPGWMHRQSGWAQSGTLFTYQNNSIVKCAVERFDRASIYTVQLGLNVGDNDGAPFQAQAEITWSINGTPIRRVVSVSQGVSISGVTESIDVRMYDVTPMLGGGPFTPSPYIGLVNVAPGPRASTALPPFLRVFPSAVTLAAQGNPGSEQVVLVPDNAGVIGLRMSWNGTGTTAPTLSMTDSTGSLFDEYALATGENSIFVPLAPGTTQILVANSDNAHTVTVNGQWAIDG